MATWLIPALKAVLPHVGTIVTAAKPMFTKPQAEDSQALQQQIAELQAATAQNDTHIRELAEQLRTTVAAIQESAAITESKSRRLYNFSLIALVTSVASACLSLFILLSR